jgi:hypothetical protein
LEPFAATFAGVAAVFNGVTFSALQWPAYIFVLSWTPWILLCVQQSWEKGGRWIVLGALASGMQVLGGMPELVALTWIFLAALWFAALIAKRISARTTALRTVWIIVLASGLTFFQTLPFLDLVAHSQRNADTATSAWSMPGWGWANLIVPLFHCYASPQGIWFQAGQDLLPSYYLGLGVIILAFLGALRSRNYVVWTVAGMALFCWIMALGTNGLLYGWLKRVAPLIGFARFPIKFAAFPGMIVPLLAAWGIKHLMEDEHRRTFRYTVVALTSGIVLTTALLWFAKKYPLASDDWNQTAQNACNGLMLVAVLLTCLMFLRRCQHPGVRMALSLATLAILPLDAFVHSPGLVPTLPADVLTPGVWQASGKPQAPKLGEGRVMVSPAAEQRLTFSYVSDLNADLIGKRMAEWYNFNLLDGLPKVTGAIPLHSAYFDSLEKKLYYTSGVVFGPGLLDFLSARWYSSESNPTQWALRNSALPILTCGQKPSFQSDNAALEAIFAPDFDARQVVYLPEGARALVTVSNQQPSKITDSAVSAHKIEASVESPAPTMVVISQSYHHLWNAFVDGRPVPLLRANYAFQAVEVPAGAHRVRLVYRDYNLVVGFCITLVSIIICGLLWRKLKPLTT